MRGVILGAAAVAISLSLGASTARAQANFSDPFYLYYGWYLPRQQVLANQPGPELGILANQAARQQAILTDRASLYEPLRGIGEDELNSLSPYSGKKGRTGIPPFSPNGLSAMNLTGKGPTSHYNRVASYYPGLRNGAPKALPKRSSSSLSRSVGVAPTGGLGGMGGMGMGGMGMGGMGGGFR